LSDLIETTQTELTNQDLKNFGAVEVLEEKIKKGKNESVLAFVDPFLQCDVCRYYVFNHLLQYLCCCYVIDLRYLCKGQGISSKPFADAQKEDVQVH
jgi:hypothetical protein